MEFYVCRLNVTICNTLTFERLLLKIFNQDLFINIKTTLNLALSKRESENNFTNKPKPFKFFIFGRNSVKNVSIRLLLKLKPSNFSLFFGTVPFKNDSYWCLALSVSEDDIFLWLNSLSKMFSNLSNDASGSLTYFRRNTQWTSDQLKL